MSQIPRRTVATTTLWAAVAAGWLGAANAQTPAVKLFKVVGARDEVWIGLTEAELAALGAGPDVERIARALVANGQLTAWQYNVRRGPDGSTQLMATQRIAVMRNDSLRIEPYTAALPVMPPPAN
jgi:hypothetical protein